ncbi:natriuretic peptides B [Hypomesus transpacificus]|uniref:natriuretic peptides B n=1 Tax=Hypomesus transpacificus TaxID=137520 RepID=UPI001F083AD8|nr:natriuretic peptides B [Hypomesus transpacificus]
MQVSSIPLLGLLFFSNLQLFCAYPVYDGLMTNDDIDVLKELLSRLESIPERREQTQTELDNVNPENNVLIGQEERWQPQTGLDQAMIREFLSARDLKTVRNDSASKRSSGCFGRRLDRIGSMSSLGCNTVGRFNPKRR